MVVITILYSIIGLLSVIFYAGKKYFYSIVFLFALVSNCYNLLPAASITPHDYIIIFVFCSFLCMGLKHLPKADKIFYPITLYIVYIFVNALITAFLGNEELVYTLITIRIALCWFLYYSLSKLDRVVLEQLFHFFYKVTIAFSCLYILQYVMGVCFLYPTSNSISSGFPRYANYPFFLHFFLIYEILHSLRGKRQLWVICIFLVAVILIQAWSGFFSIVIAFLFYYLLIKKKVKQIMGILLFSCVVCLVLLLTPFAESIQEVSTDIAGVEFNSENYSEGDGTFTFRIALLAERFEYISREPEMLLFGAGPMNENSPKTEKRFNFRITTWVNDFTKQLKIDTMDLTWANVLLKYGLVGAGLFVWQLLRLLHLFKRFAKKDIVALSACLYIFSLLVLSFFSDLMMPPVIFMIVFIYTYFKKVSYPDLAFSRP